MTARKRSQQLAMDDAQASVPTPSPITAEQFRQILREELEIHRNEERRQRINRGRVLGAQL